MSMTSIAPKNHFKKIASKAKGRELNAENTSWLNGFYHCHKYDLFSVKTVKTTALVDDYFDRDKLVQSLHSRISKIKLNHYPEVVMPTVTEEGEEISEIPLYQKLLAQNQNIKQITRGYYVSFFKTMSGIFDHPDDSSESARSLGEERHPHRFIVVPGHLYQTYPWVRAFDV